MKVELGAMKSLCKEFNVFLQAMHSAWCRAKHDGTEPALQQNQLMAGILCNFHDEFIQARENLEKMSITFAQMSVTKLPLWLVHLGRL